MLLALLCTGNSPAVAKPSHVKTHKAAGSIGVFINGTALSIDPPPRYIRGRLLVPVRRILDALGLPFERTGVTIKTQVADRTILLTAGSRRAFVNGDPMLLDLPPVEVKGVLYASLRFFTAGLGALAQYDPKNARVEITSRHIGQSTTEVSIGGGAREYVGVVQAIDNDSQPPSITVTSGASVKTISIPWNVKVVINDVAANTTANGQLSDVHVGDYAKIVVRKDGNVERVVDSFASRHGKLSAISGNTLVLADGHVIVPTGVTALSLNGEGAKVGDLLVGDELTVRYNLESFEVREIIAIRNSAGTPAPPGAVSIASIVPSVTHPLRSGDSFEVVMRGTPGGQASYDVGPYFTGLPMREATPGNYVARFTVPRGANFSSVPVFGHLSGGGVQASRAQSELEISAASVGPGIGDFAPDDGQTVNNNEPSIYATFSAGAVPINVSSIALVINGHDVTSSAARSASFIEYHPLVTYGDGPVRVTVRVSDLAGNTSSKSWTFSIRTH